MIPRKYELEVPPILLSAMPKFQCQIRFTASSRGNLSKAAPVANRSKGLPNDLIVHMYTTFTDATDAMARIEQYGFCIIWDCSIQMTPIK